MEADASQILVWSISDGKLRALRLPHQFQKMVMAALKAAPAVIDLLYISAEDYMDRTPAVPTTSEPIPLAHPASHLATPFDPAPPPGCPVDVELTAPSNKVDLFQYLVQISEPVLTNLYCLQRHGRPLKTQVPVQARWSPFRFNFSPQPIRSQLTRCPDYQEIHRLASEAAGAQSQEAAAVSLLGSCDLEMVGARSK